MYGISRILSLGMSKLNATPYCIYDFKIIVLPIVDTKLSLKNSLEGKNKKRIWSWYEERALFRLSTESKRPSNDHISTELRSLMKG